MKGKNIITLALAGTLCCLASFPTFAKEITAPGDQKTELTFSVKTDYIVVIPESAKLDGSLVITSPKANTEPGMAVKIRISEGLTNDGKVTLDRDNDTSDYAITADLKQKAPDGSDKAVTANTVIASFADVTSETTGATLIFGTPTSPDENPVKAGSYTGSLTFAISYENQ